MPLNKEARIKKIKGVLSDHSKKVGEHKIEWDGESKYRPVYRIPIDYLIYNKYNGRILSRTKSLEVQNKKLDAENKDDSEKIEKMLYESHRSRNKKTQKSILGKGQEKPGIVTTDGVIVDGNRRFMFLNRIIKDSDKTDTEKFKYFEAVILPVSLAENPDGIRRLETTYQMGEDKKLDYNPIEKYLKTQELVLNGVSEEDIALWMGEDKKDIEKYSQTMKTMDDYLEYLEYEGVYTQLDGREDWFLSLAKWTAAFRGKDGSEKPFDGYKPDDVDDLEVICYDYIRAKHGGDGKRFRKIAEGQKENHIFGNKGLWDTFKSEHFSKISSIRDNEAKINLDSNDLNSHLNDRDKKFTELAEENLKENLNDRISDLSNKKNHDKPEKLIKKANNALREINIKADSFCKQGTQKELQAVADKVSKLLCDGNISLMLELSLQWLEGIKLDDLSSEDAEKRRGIVTDINKLSFEMKKKLGG